MEDLWRYLHSAIQNLTGTAFCVADALDETGQGNDEFLQSLASFGAQAQRKRNEKLK